ncbi:hypothetical protein JGI17_10953 [Candidatus Kryptonium thompsonii]|nr:hypothetical protein JGI17_10953 [Candidatus Kryptonium thompsoni]
MKRKLLLLLLLPLICYSQKNLPISREATFIESYSPSEVTIRASGIGKNNTQAELDGRRAAVWYVLIGATDAILQTPEEKKAFESVQDEIFDERNIAKYISFETTEYESRVKLADGRVKITKYYRVNKKLLTEDLVAKNIIKPKEEITEAIGLPFISPRCDNRFSIFCATNISSLNLNIVCYINILPQENMMFKFQSRWKH